MVIFSPTRTKGDDFFDLFGGPVMPAWTPHYVHQCVGYASNAGSREETILRVTNKPLNSPILVRQFQALCHMKYRGKLSYAKARYNEISAILFDFATQPRLCCYTPLYCANCDDLPLNHASDKCLFVAGHYEPGASPMDKFAAGWRDRRFHWEAM